MDGPAATRPVADYIAYVSASRGELSVAVNLEVKSRSGWFSDRSAAYLAAGKPVIVQDTGFSESLPCGQGLFAFTAVDEAAEAIRKVELDYRRHCDTARGLASAFFRADVVLSELLAQSGVDVPRRDVPPGRSGGGTTTSRPILLVP